MNLSQAIRWSRTQNQPSTGPRHDFDADAVCVKCGFDGAEWRHLNNVTGQRTPQPLCTGLPFRGGQQ